MALKNYFRYGRVRVKSDIADRLSKVAARQMLEQLRGLTGALFWKKPPSVRRAEKLVEKYLAGYKGVISHSDWSGLVAAVASLTKKPKRRRK
jgi:hypothetical protein